jgi:hypothetical protein
LNEVVIIDIKFNLRKITGLKRMFRWLLLAVTPFFLLAGCGDLEPEMQDTRTVILNMDFHGKSSSRSSSSVSASELSQYNTHLILALPSWENLTSSYRNYDSSFAQGLMNTADKKVSLEIPLDTDMKIFAFLFQEDYDSTSKLFSETPTVGYYGESPSFKIGTQTNNLSLGITLQSAGTTGDSDPGTGTDIAPAAPVISGISSGTYTTSQIFTVNGDSGATIQYSLDGGTTWLAYSAAVTLTNEGSYTITARQRSDAAVNWSVNATYITVVINQATDTTAPTVTFSPDNGTTGIAISDNITITFSEAVRNSIDNTELTDSNIDSDIITLKLNNASGSNISFDATINTEKTVITINPTSNLPNLQGVYVALDATLEDYANNAITAANATFTTMTLQPTAATQPPLQNTGTSYNAYSNKYVVSTLGHLSYIAQNSSFLAYNFIQTANIDATVTKFWDDEDSNSDGDKYNDANDVTDSGNNEGFLPIGNKVDKFTGEYDGNKKAINGLTITRNSNNNTGLFGWAKVATISKLGLTNVNITGKDSVGQLVGLAHSTEIINCYATSGTVTGNNNVGGLIGWLYGYASITNSYSKVDNITAPPSWFVQIGGLVAVIENSTVTDSFYDNETSGQSDTGSWCSPSCKGTAKTTAEMKTKATFTDTTTTGLSTSWDFDTIWNIDTSGTINDGYPYLR